MDKPTEVRLFSSQKQYSKLMGPGEEKSKGAGSPEFDEIEYRAMDVACGPTFTLAVGVQQEQVRLVADDRESEAIARKLGDVLLKEGSLVRFFSLWQDANCKPFVKKLLKQKNKTGQGDGDDTNAACKALQEMDPYQLRMTTKTFKTSVLDYWRDVNSPDVDQLITSITSKRSLESLQYQVEDEFTP